MSGVRRHDPEATREAILSAAAAEILENSYAAATLASIAARLHLTKGALAYHFPTKRDLAVALSRRMAGIVNEIKGTVAVTYPEGGVRALVGFLFLIGEKARRDPIVAVGVTIDSDASLGDLELPEQFPAWVLIFTDYLEQAEELGEFSPALEHMSAAEHVLSTMIGAFYYLQRVPERRLTPRLRFLRASLRGIGFTDADAIVDEVLAAIDEVPPPS